MSLVNPVRQIWKTYQILGDINPPTLNTLHSIVSSTTGMRVIAIELVQTNTPTNAEEIDVVIEADGNTWIYDASVIGVINNNNKYGVKALPHNIGEAVYNLDLQDINASGAAPLLISDGQTPGFGLKEIEGQDVDVQVRQTSAIAAGARIRAKVTYQLLETF